MSLRLGSPTITFLHNTLNEALPEKGPIKQIDQLIQLFLLHKTRENARKTNYIAVSMGLKLDCGSYHDKLMQIFSAQLQAVKQCIFCSTQYNKTTTSHTIKSK
jgi:hypothetical protein